MAMLKTGTVVTVYVMPPDEARMSDLLGRERHIWLRTTGHLVSEGTTHEVVVLRVSIVGVTLPSRGSGRLVKLLRELQQNMWLTFDVTSGVGY